jgi:pyridoxamine 5'-phosphate oxidase
MTNANDTLQNLRVSYKMAKLDIADCAHDPEVQFNHWLHEAIKSACDEPNAFVLSTIAGDKPRARVVLLKGLHEGKFVFYTNYYSAKGQEISLNDHVAMTFLWLPLQRQVRIEGTVSKTPESLSDEYFTKRPRGSQLGAIASPQSQKVASREELEKFFHQAEIKFGAVQQIPRPEHWGGYEITPQYFEFWQGRDNRMHDRICFEKQPEGWELARLAP